MNESQLQQLYDLLEIARQNNDAERSNGDLEMGIHPDNFSCMLRYVETLMGRLVFHKLLIQRRAKETIKAALGEREEEEGEEEEEEETHN